MRSAARGGAARQGAARRGTCSSHVQANTSTAPSPRPKRRAAATRSHAAATRSHAAATRSHVTATRSHVTATRSHVAAPRSHDASTRSHAAATRSHAAATRSQARKPPGASCDRRGPSRRGGRAHQATRASKSRSRRIRQARRRRRSRDTRRRVAPPPAQGAFGRCVGCEGKVGARDERRHGRRIAAARPAADECLINGLMERMGAAEGPRAGQRVRHCSETQRDRRVRRC